VEKFHENVSAWIKSAQKYTKFWVAVIGGAFAIVAGELPIDDEVAKYIQVGLLIATAFSVYQFPNAPTDAE
jgi:hypothetical protein